MPSDQLEGLTTQAFLTLLAGNNALTVFDGVVPDGTDPDNGYVLVYAMLNWPKDGASNALDGRSVTMVPEFNCHCVSTTAAGARAIQAQVRATALDQRLTVAGRQSGLIYMTQALAPNRDETTGRPVMDAVIDFSLISTP